MTNAADWQGAVGRNWAAEWQRTDRSFAELNTVLVDRIVAKARPDARILDIGCGAGATSLALAQRLPQPEIVGIDLSESLAAAARARNAEARVRFEVCDATSWSGGDWQPDMLVSRHGVMFFDDPVTAFARLAEVAAPAAQLVFSCFQVRSANAWASEVPALLPVPPAPVAPHAPGPFAFADPDHVRAILARAGWKDAEAEPVDFSYVAGAGEDPVADAIDFFTRIGPAAPLIRNLDEGEKIAFFDRLSQLLCNRLANGTVSFHAAAWIWSAHR
jgi:SAM-dependent methyltransferase